MDLHIIQMFQTHIMFFRNIKGVTCEMWIVGGMLISSSDPAACQDRILCINLYRDLSARLDLFLSLHRFSGFHSFKTCPVRFCGNCLQTCTFAVFHKNILHGSIFQNCYIFKLQNLLEQFFGNFFSRDILMIKDPRSGMCTFSCIGKIISIHLEIHAISDKIINDISGASDHNVYRLFSVFVMSCLHGVFKIAVVIVFITEHTDSPLRQERITTPHILFCDDHDLFFPRKLQGTEHTCNTCSHDHYVCFNSHCFSPLCLDFSFQPTQTNLLYKCVLFILPVPASAPAVSSHFHVSRLLHEPHSPRFSERGELFPEILFSCFCRPVRFL